MIYYSVGSALVTGEELFQPQVFDRITGFHSGLLKNAQPASVTLSTGELNAENFITTFAQPREDRVEFKPIGLGLPLTIMIRQVYTGKHPKGNIFSRKKGMLLSSAIKSIATTDAKPKALNFLKDNVGSQTRLDRPAASEQGTPIVFYSPALLDRSLTLDLTMVFDNFPEEVFEQIGDFFTSAAGLPIFFAHSAYLIGAGFLLKLLGNAGEAIFDGSPSFESSDGIDIFLPGRPPIPPGFVLVTSDDVDRIDPDFRRKHQVNSEGKVVDSRGNEYNGEIPFIVISLDGTKDDQLNSFTPTAVSAAVLSRFLGVKNKQQQSIDVLLSALKLHNDFSFRREIDRIDKQLENMPAGDEKTALEKKRKALLENISEDIFKPKE